MSWRKVFELNIPEGFSCECDGGRRYAINSEACHLFMPTDDFF
jgi:hypothetical protein